MNKYDDDDDETGPQIPAQLTTLRPTVLGAAFGADKAVR